MTKRRCSIKSWGRFSENANGESTFRGRLRYDPIKGIELELVEYGLINTKGRFPEVPRTIYGWLAGGTPVTLTDCFLVHYCITNSEQGKDITSPTRVLVNVVLFGYHFADLDKLPISKYSFELTSLHNWTCFSPLTVNHSNTPKNQIGWNLKYRCPPSIHVNNLANGFDLEIRHSEQCNHKDDRYELRWAASATIQANDTFTLKDAMKAEWQCSTLMSLLIGHPVSVISIDIMLPESSLTGPQECLVYLLAHQRGRHDCPNRHPAEMLFPYVSIANEFSGIARKWFARSQQAVLASDVFFGVLLEESLPVSARFLMMTQAAESYHRSLGTGLYMVQEEYDQAIVEFVKLIPETIWDDHRQSLKQRIRFGNEYSLRKRLNDLLRRIPENLSFRIAGNINHFVQMIVDTRNHYTHFDQAHNEYVLVLRHTLILG